jgi:capsular exopolysaccharide synthesis family protein
MSRTPPSHSNGHSSSSGDGRLSVPDGEGREVARSAPRRPRRRREPASEADAGGIDLSVLGRTLRHGKWIILVTCVLVTGAIGAYTYTLDPIFEAESIVAVNPQSDGQTANVLAFGPQRDLDSEVGILRYSAELAERVAGELQATAEALGDADPFPILFGAEGEALTTNEVSTRLLEEVRFTALPAQSMIRVSVESSMPEEASTVVNIYAREYRTFSREKARASVTAAREFLEEQTEKRRQDIMRLEKQWEAFAQNNQVVTQGVDGQRLIEEYSELTARRDQLGFERDQEQSALRILEDQLQQFRPELQRNVKVEQETSGLRSEIGVLEQRIGEMRAEAAQYYVANPNLEGDAERIRTRFPDLHELLGRIDGLQQRKDQLTEELVATASSVDGSAAQEGGSLERIAQLRSLVTEKELAISQLDAQIEALDARLEGYGPRLQRIPQQTIQREQIERKLEQAETFYASVAAQLQKTIIAEESELGYVDVVRQAFVPAVPVRPNMKMNLILGLALGLGFGVGLAFLRQAMSNEIEKPEDLQEQGYPLVGVVPDMKDEIKALFDAQPTIEVSGRRLDTHLLPLLHPWSPITENYRLIRTNLKFAAEDADAPPVLLVTSPGKGEGKSTTAVNLALTYVLGGASVLLIDADMRRPSTHRLLDLEATPGLSDLLDGTESSVVTKTFVDGLYYVPAGTTDDPPTENLDASTMRRLIEMGRERCDVVIVDSPPVLAVSDALVLAGLCTTVVVVAAANGTTHRALRLTQNMLDGVGVDVDGVVFNGYRHTDGQYGYGYYYERYEERETDASPTVEARKQVQQIAS